MYNIIYNIIRGTLKQSCHISVLCGHLFRVFQEGPFWCRFVTWSTTCWGRWPDAMFNSSSWLWRSDLLLNCDIDWYRSHHSSIKGMSLQFCSRIYNCKCWNEVLICSGSVVLLDACVSYIRFHYDFVHYCLIIWLYSQALSCMHTERYEPTAIDYSSLFFVVDSTYAVHNSQHTRWCDMPSCTLGNGMNLR